MFFFVCLFVCLFVFLMRILNQMRMFDWLIDWLILAVLGLRFRARAFSSCGKRGPLFIAMRGPLSLRSTGSRRAAQAFTFDDLMIKSTDIQRVHELPEGKYPQPHFPFPPVFLDLFTLLWLLSFDCPTTSHWQLFMLQWLWREQEKGTQSTQFCLQSEL